MSKPFDAYRQAVEKRYRQVHKVLANIGPRNAAPTLHPVYFTGEDYLRGRLDDWSQQYPLLMYCGVYVWYRLEKRLVLRDQRYITRRDWFVRYVGRTDKSCWERIRWGFPHEHIRPDTVMSSDKLVFYPCKCWNEAVVLEIDVNRLFEPPVGQRRDRIGLYEYLLEFVGQWEPRPDPPTKRKLDGPKPRSRSRAQRPSSSTRSRCRARASSGALRVIF